MLYTQSFVFNPFQENTFIIYNDEKECWIVDPGMYGAEELSQFTQYLSGNGFKPQSIINTHTHIDHIFGVPALMELYRLPFGIHAADKPVLDGAAGSAMLFGFEYRQIPQPTFYIEAGKPLQLGADSVDVRFVPGHSPGSVAFYYAPGNWVIAGDALFSGSIGRTDLPGGNHNQLLESIRTQLFSLPDDTTVYCGHGPSTSIGNEKMYNPFLQD